MFDSYSGLTKYSCVMLLMIFNAMLFADKAISDSSLRAGTIPAKIEHPFIQNMGQYNEEVLFYIPISAGGLSIIQNGSLKYNIKSSDVDNKYIEFIERFSEKCLYAVTGINPAGTKINYFRSKDRKRWKSNILAFNRLDFGYIDEGIRMQLRSAQNNMEKIFYIEPGANPDRLLIRLDGIAGLSVSQLGELRVITNQGTISFTKPVAYQNIDGDIQYVKASYKITDNTYGFYLGEYDRNYMLIIDPLLASTYLGGSGNDGWEYSDVVESAIDNDGNILVAGMTASADFPSITGCYECESCNGYDLFVAKFSADLSELLAVTVIGGSNDEIYPRVKVSGNGNIYLLGHSYSSDYPTTSGAFESDYQGNGDIVISCFDQDLNTLLASTYIGGTGSEFFPSLDLDAANNIFISGVTSHDSYPTIEGSYRTDLIGSDEYFISKLSSDLSTLIASTFIGGLYDERHSEMVVASSGEVILTGSSASYDYPTTPGVFDRTFNGSPPYGDLNKDVVVSKLDNDLTNLLASTFVGTEDYEGGIMITVDEDGYIYFGGHTTSIDYPTTTGVFDEIHNEVNEFFITKISPDLSILEASTYLTPGQIGGYGFIFCNDMTIDNNGRLILIGTAWDDSLYTTEDAYDRTFNGEVNDIGIMVMSHDLTTVEYATYLGGTGDEMDGTVCVDPQGNIYAALYTSSTDFPLPAGRWQTGYAGGEKDCIVAKLTTDRFSRVTEGPHVNDANISMGVSWVDYDNDSYPDIFIANDDGTNDLYRNNGEGNFTKLESDVVVSEGNSFHGCWADYDDDGDNDVIVTNGVPHDSEGNYFYANDGDGTFTKLTDNVIAADVSESRVASFVDYNNDGKLDIFVANHSADIPNGHAPDFLYQNTGYDFIKITTGEVVTNTTITTYASWCDYDNDGDQDLYLEKPFSFNVLFDNQGDGSFAENTQVTIANDADIGSFCWGDYNNDGNMDLFSPVYQNNNNILYKNTGTGDFEKINGLILVNDQGWSSCGSWGDFDNDGDLDLFVTNSMYTNSNFLYQNNGNGTFSKIIEGAIVDNWSPSTSAAWCDYDCDGDLDLYVTVWLDDLRNLLFKNNGNNNNWININCVGTNSNRSAIGAKIRLLATIDGAPTWQLREISTNSGFCAQNYLNAHFGLGNTAIIDTIRVEWPSGMVDVFASVGVNQFLTITETRCGDTNNDEAVNIGDVVYLVNLIFHNGPSPVVEAAGDVNCDGNINVGDAVFLGNFIFQPDAPKPCLGCR